MDEIPLDRICPKSTSLSDPAFQLDSMTYLFESFRRSLPYLNSKVSFILVKYFCDLSHIFVLFSTLQQEYDVKTAQTCQMYIFKQASLCLLLDVEMEVEKAFQSLLNILISCTHPNGRLF